MGQRVLVLCAAFLIGAAGCGYGDHRGIRQPRLDPDPPGWSSLPPPPEARAWAVSLWTGDQLFLWGGERESAGNPYRADGALFDRSSGWQHVAAGPLSGRLSAGAVWTGTEALIWGGRGGEPLGDGAAFDPRRRRWRRLAASPLSGREPAVTVWTGSEMIVWGHRDRSAEALDGAAYDPAADRWRRLPAAPFALNEASATWTGGEMVVFGAQLNESNRSRGAEHAQGIAYDPLADRWRVIAPYPLSPQASSVASTGSGVLAWDYELRAGLYEPATDRWRPLPDLPLRFAECYPQSARIGETILAWYCGQGALYDIASESWRRVSSPDGEIFGPPVSAGSEVVFPGASYEGRRNALWAYEPS